MLKEKDVLVLKDVKDWKIPVGTIFSVVEIQENSIVIDNNKYGNITVLKEYLDDFFKLYYLKYHQLWTSGYGEAEYLVDYCDPSFSSTYEDLKEDIVDYLGHKFISSEELEHHRGLSFEEISREEYNKETGSCVNDNINLLSKTERKKLNLLSQHSNKQDEISIISFLLENQSTTPPFRAG